MESKSDFLMLPVELRLSIYTQLSLSTRASLFSTSKQTKNDIPKLYQETHPLVLEFLSSKKRENYDEENKALYEKYNILEWLQDSLAFHQFIHKIYRQFLNNYFVIQTDNDAPFNIKGNIYLKVDNKELQCSTSTNLLLKESIKIQTEYLDGTPLTMEMVEPFKDTIKHQLGLAAVKTFFDSFDFYLLFLLTKPNFQECFKRGKIDFQSISSYILMKGYNSDFAFNILAATIHLQKSHLKLSDCIALWEHSNILNWLRDHPKEHKKLLDCGSYDKKLDLLTNIHFFKSIENGTLTMDTFLEIAEKVGNTQINALIKPYISHLKYKTLYEFYCEELGASNRYIKGKAILALLGYIADRDDEDSEDKNASSFYNVSNLFKKMNNSDYESKVTAAKKLVRVLFETPEYVLSENEIAVLTKQPLISSNEDRLTRIVRTMVLEPLELNSLEEIHENYRNSPY